MMLVDSSRSQRRRRRPHRCLQLARRHPAVRHGHAHLRHQLGQPRRARSSCPRCAGRRRSVWPPRACSRRIASRMTTASNGVRRCAPPAGRPAAWRSGSSRARRSAPAAGCAGSASRSASARARRSRSSFNRSLCATPKCCSSSTISRPRSRNSTSLASSACVPMTMSMRAVLQRRLDLASPPCRSPAATARPIAHGKAWKRSTKVR